MIKLPHTTRNYPRIPADAECRHQHKPDRKPIDNMLHMVYQFNNQTVLKAEPKAIVRRR